MRELWKIEPMEDTVCDSAKLNEHSLLRSRGRLGNSGELYGD